MLKLEKTGTGGHRTSADAKRACQNTRHPVTQRPKGVPLTRVPTSQPVNLMEFGKFVVKSMLVDAVKVDCDRRLLNHEKVDTLETSMGKIGLKTPITVRKQKEEIILVAGWHRLEAARQLGWKTIPCFVVEADEEALPWRIIENLHRAELTVLERADYIEEIRALLEMRAKGGQVAPPGGQQPGDVGINKTAEALGFTREEVRRAKEIAGISAEAKAEARKLAFDDNQSALLKIARLPTSEAQLSALREIDERTRQPRISRTHAVAATRTGEKAAVGTEATQSQLANSAEASKSRVVGHAEGREEKTAPVATTAPGTVAASWDGLDIPPCLDRRPLSPEDSASLAALTAAWEAASELKLTWAKASTRAREQFIDKIKRG